MANEQNLIPHQFKKGQVDREAAARAGRKGAAVTAEKKRKRRAMAETLEILLNMALNSGEKCDAADIKAFADIRGENVSVDQAIMVKLIQRALKGDLSAIALIRDTVGEKPVEAVSVDATVKKNPLQDLTTEELRALIARE